MADAAFRALGPSTLLAPLPVVMLSCTNPDTGKDNLITVAWTGIINSDPPMLSVSIRPDRFSHDIIAKTGVFCVNLIDQKLCHATDFCGVKSGRDTDKFKACHLHAFRPEGFDAPALQEAPAFLCCRVKQMIPLGSHDLFLCNIEQVWCHENLLDQNGGLHLEKAKLVSYSHGEYYALSDVPMGFFGYSVAREEILSKRLPKHKTGTSSRKGASRK